MNDTDARAEAASPASFLDDVRIASPCRANWDEMIGDDRVRFCGQCTKNVYNLCALSREDAEALLRAGQARDGRFTGAGEGICVRLYRRADGTVITADCPDGVRRKKRRLALFGAIGAGLMAAGAAACGRGAPLQGEPARIPFPTAHGAGGAPTMGDVGPELPAPSLQPLTGLVPRLPTR